MATVSRLLPDCVNDLTHIEEICFGDEKWNAAMLLAEFENPLAELYGIVKDGRVVAYLSAKIIFDEAHIGNVAVLPDYRKIGYARRLLENLFKRCKKSGVKSFTLEVNVNNLPAISLYKSCGFECKGIRKKYYRNQDEALVLWKTL